MTTVSLQFHATTAEVESMAADFSRRAGLDMFAGDGFFVLGPQPLVRSRGADLYRLRTANDHLLVMQPGALRETGLSASAMDGSSTDPQISRLWRRLIDRARRSMHSGAVITDPATGRLGRVAGHRFTDGALHLQNAGIKMRGIAGTQLWRLTPDTTPAPLPDQDMIALSAITSRISGWIQGGLLPPALVEDLTEHAQLGAGAGEVAAAIHDLTRRLHDAFARNDEPFRPSPRESTYLLHLPTRQQADAAASEISAPTIVHGPTTTRRLPWDLCITLPGPAPEPAHEALLVSLAHRYGGAYAGQQRAEDPCPPPR